LLSCGANRGDKRARLYQVQGIELRGVLCFFCNPDIVRIGLGNRAIGKSQVGRAVIDLVSHNIVNFGCCDDAAGIMSNAFGIQQHRQLFAGDGGADSGIIAFELKHLIAGRDLEHSWQLVFLSLLL
jgi:hypothetical protein